MSRNSQNSLQLNKKKAMWLFEENVVVHWYFLEDHHGARCLTAEKGRNHFKGSPRTFTDLVSPN